MSINAPNSGSSTSEFQSAMKAAGLDYQGQIIADGTLHRVKVNGDKAANSWYVLHLDGIPAGSFGCNKRMAGEKINWCALSAEQLTAEQRAERDRKWREQQQQREQERQQSRKKAADSAADILAAAQPATDEHPYLLKKSVKAHPGLMLGAWSQGKQTGCLLIPLKTADGALATIQALSSGAPFHHGGNKDFLKGGAKTGAYFVFGDPANSAMILIAEGYATAATLAEATGNAAVMACDSGNLTPVAKAIRAIYPTSKIIICGDDDRKTDGNPGVKAAAAAAKASGAMVAIPVFGDNEDGSDWNDWAALHGIGAVAEAVDAATAKPGKAKAAQPAMPAAFGRIRLAAGELPSALVQAETALIAANAGIFQRGGMLVRISTDPGATVRAITRPAGTPVISALDKPRLKNILDQCCEFEKWNERAGDFLRCSANNELAERMLSLAGEWRFPVLTGVINAPTLRPDGSLLEQPGYDPATGLFFDSTGIQFIPIDDAPSRADAIAALQWLADNVLHCKSATGGAAGFPFKTAAAESAALAAILTAVVRQALPTAPLFLFSAHAAGTGKSLLADVVALIARGKPATVFDFATDEDEQRKAVLAVLIAGDSVVNLDNLTIPLGGPAIDKALTQEEVTGRILGLSRTATAPTNITFLATGNNAKVLDDTTRRVVLCQLDAGCEQPAAREYQRDLMEWIPQKRALLVTAVLVALRAYVVAGKPKQSLPMMGSFEAWSRLVRSALVWLGYADPLADTAKMESDDPVRARLRPLMNGWFECYGNQRMTCKDAIAQATGDFYEFLKEDFYDAKRGVVSSRWLGDFLSKIKGRVDNGLRFESPGGYQGVAMWRLAGKKTAEKPENGENRNPLILKEAGGSGGSGGSYSAYAGIFAKNEDADGVDDENKDLRKTIDGGEQTHQTHETHRAPVESTTYETADFAKNQRCGAIVDADVEYF